MRISIIIPAYNEERYLPGCLQGVLDEIAGCPDPASVEVIVVDNASTDRTAEVAGAFRGVRVVREPQKGLTRARQKGLSEARGDILAYVDADTRMPSGWITHVLRTFDSSRDVVCVSGPYIYYDASLVERVLSWLYWTVLAVPAYWIIRYMVVGGNFAARKDALIAIGGFDTDIAFYGEDTNIARRLHVAGKVKFVLRLSMPTSSRRLHAEGLWTTALRYVANFLSEVVLKRPVTRSYKDVR
ncbi:MAG: glycosyltransferase [Gammaproteobacteria bacterium]|nr:glycosyltransferase [Gammaproteobacteria bacterium]